VALPESSQLDAVALSLPIYLESIEKHAIKEALVMTSLNKTAAAAKLLGVSFRSLRYRLAKHKC
jgi:two-component system response regulator PilR (NtrC family)